MLGKKRRRRSYRREHLLFAHFGGVIDQEVDDDVAGAGFEEHRHLGRRKHSKSFTSFRYAAVIIIFRACIKIEVGGDGAVLSRIGVDDIQLFNGPTKTLGSCCGWSLHNELHPPK